MMSIAYNINIYIHISPCFSLVLSHFICNSAH